MDEREIIDQLGTTGTYVTRDGDGVLRHWNAITDEYVGSEPGNHRFLSTDNRALRNVKRLLDAIARGEVTNVVLTVVAVVDVDGRIVNLDDYGDDCDDDAVRTLQMLVQMHGEPHRLWRITPAAGGAWNYEKAHGES